MPSPEILRADNLSRWLPERRIVTGVTFSVTEGELVAIAAPSGAGKSSLNRLDEPTSGSVFVEGQDYRQVSPRELRRRVSLVTQRPFLFPGSVVDNICFGPQERVESLDASVRSLIPVGSMLIANAMNGNALALERFWSDVEAHVGEIQSALALGAAPDITVSPYAHAVLRASLIPSVDNLRSLGVVPRIDGGHGLVRRAAAVGVGLSVLVLAMIFVSSGLTCFLSTRWIGARAFTAAEQLVLR